MSLAQSYCTFILCCSLSMSGRHAKILIDVSFACLHGRSSSSGNALRDTLCYLCRYGIGQIYYRQEKYEMAEFHFRRSLEVCLSSLNNQ